MSFTYTARPDVAGAQAFDPSDHSYQDSLPPFRHQQHPQASNSATSYLNVPVILACIANTKTKLDAVAKAILKLFQNSKRTLEISEKTSETSERTSEISEKTLEISEKTSENVFQMQEKLMQGLFGLKQGVSGLENGLDDVRKELNDYREKMERTFSIFQHQSVSEFDPHQELKQPNSFLSPTCNTKKDFLLPNTKKYVEERRRMSGRQIKAPNRYSPARSATSKVRKSPKKRAK